MEKPLETGKNGEMVVGKASWSPNYGQTSRLSTFDRNKLVCSNYKNGITNVSAHIPKPWAKQILQMEVVCRNEGLGPEDSKQLVTWIFNEYPELKEEFPELV